MSLIAAAVMTALIAKPEAAAAKQCPDILDYLGWAEAPGQQWDFRSPKLTVIGAEHSREPSHRQFAAIAADFAKAKPTLVLFEGPDRGTRDSAETAIRETGESGYLRFLASAAGVPSRSLEPSPPQQIEMLMSQFAGDQALLFFVVREAVRMRDREKLGGDALDAAVAKLLAKVAPMEAALGAPLAFKGTAGLQAAFARYWPGQDWKSADAGWFSPSADDKATGGQFFGAINRADSSNRNRHMVRIFREAVGRGERPFVVVGRNHVPMISTALECAVAGL